MESGQQYDGSGQRVMGVWRVVNNMVVVVSELWGYGMVNNMMVVVSELWGYGEWSTIWW